MGERILAGAAAGSCRVPTPSWTQLEPPPSPSKGSGLTSSDDAPRYRRGSKRRPKPPRTPPGLVQPLHANLAVARFQGRGRGYAAVREISASAMLLQERPKPKALNPKP